MTGLPSRYPSAVHIEQPLNSSTATVYLVFNGYNRRFIEGPGAAAGPRVEGRPHQGRWGVAWTNESGRGTPDVPATDVVRYGNKLVVGTDYGVMVATIDTAGDVTGWKRVGGCLRQCGCAAAHDRVRFSRSARTATSTRPRTAVESGGCPRCSPALARQARGPAPRILRCGALALSRRSAN